MDEDGTRHRVRRHRVRRVRLRRVRRLQPLKARLALGQRLLHRSQLTPPHRPLGRTHLLLAHVRPPPASVRDGARGGRF